MKLSFLCCALPLMLSAIACSGSSYAVVTPGGRAEQVRWSEEELLKDVAIQNRIKGEHATSHIARIAAAEEPHLHSRSDLFVTVLDGELRLHLEDTVLDVKPGMVIEIPKNTPHWAEPIDGKAVQVYLIFSPGYDPTDKVYTPR